MTRHPYGFCSHPSILPLGMTGMKFRDILILYTPRLEFASSMTSLVTNGGSSVPSSIDVDDASIHPSSSENFGLKIFADRGKIFQEVVVIFSCIICQYKFDWTHCYKIKTSMLKFILYFEIQCSKYKKKSRFLQLSLLRCGPA